MISTAPVVARDGDLLGDTLRGLAAGVILVALLGYGAVDAEDATFPRLDSPLTTRALSLHAMFEGMPEGDRVARRWFRSHGSGYDVQVYFGTARVTARLRARADAVLAGLRFARPPHQAAAAGATTRCRSERLRPSAATAAR